MTTKIAISLPDDLVDHARRAVEAGHATSMSAYIAGAIGDRVRNDELTTLLDEMLAETGGPMTDEERAEADRLLG